MGTSMKLDTEGFENLIYKLNRLNADVKTIVGDQLEQLGEEVEWQTKDAIAKSNLPAKGIYSKGDTEKSIVTNPKVRWAGTLGEINVGFDYSKPGAGGYLITGTPRMKPDYALKKLYKGKQFTNWLKESMREALEEEIRFFGG